MQRGISWGIRIQDGFFRLSSAEIVHQELSNSIWFVLSNCLELGLEVYAPTRPPTNSTTDDFYTEHALGPAVSDKTSPEVRGSTAEIIDQRRPDTVFTILDTSSGSRSGELLVVLSRQARISCR